MKQIYFATKNKGKVSYLTNSLKSYNVEVIHVSMELPEPRSDDLREIAKEKVLFAFEKIKKPCVVVDSGFYIHSLNGFPRAFVNFTLETIGVKGMLDLIKEKPRTCEFRNCLAYIDKSIAEPVYFESAVKGSLAENLRGKMDDKRDYSWSDLWLVFIPQGESRTLAEMNFNDYQEWKTKRHTDSFATSFAEWLSNKKP
jgi:XTP/dITP diphosphohydrolase